MHQEKIKAALIALLIIWLIAFSMDSIFGIDWPSYTAQRVFIWTPTVLIGVYWLIFGGAKKKEK